MSDEDWQVEQADARLASAPDRKLGQAQAIYLVASALATMGWFWFIGWCALQLV